MSLKCCCTSTTVFQISMILSRSFLSIPLSEMEMVENFSEIRFENRARLDLSFSDLFLSLYVGVTPVRHFSQKSVRVGVLCFPVSRMHVRNLCVLRHGDVFCRAVTNIHALRFIDTKVLNDLQQHNRIGLERILWRPLLLGVAKLVMRRRIFSDVRKRDGLRNIVILRREHEIKDSVESETSYPVVRVERHGFSIANDSGTSSLNLKQRLGDCRIEL